MHILITLDQNDLLPLRAMLHSLFRGNPGEPFEIHMPYDGIPAGQVAALSGRCNRHGSRLLPVAVRRWILSRRTKASGPYPTSKS